MRTTKPTVRRWKWSKTPNTAWFVDGLRDEHGKRVRKFFPARDAANRWLAQRRPELTNQGRGAVSLNDRQRIDATEALKILAPFGVSLVAAARAYADRAAVLSRTIEFGVLRAELVATKTADRASAAYLHDLEHRLNRFGQTFDNRPVAGIETREIDDWLRGLGLSPSSRHNYRKVLRTAFEFAVARNYAATNPVTKTATVKIEKSSPGILTPAEISALLEAADSQIVASLAIAAFAGLRDAEIGRLTWDKVDVAGGHIKVDASIAKTASRRVIPMSANLAAWLAPLALKVGPLRPAFITYYRLCKQARAAAAASLKDKGLPNMNLTTWPNNALRHSFASYRMAVVGDAAKVAEECGHSIDVMKSHYRELVTRSEGEAWFHVLPQTNAEKIVAFSGA